MMTRRYQLQSIPSKHAGSDPEAFWLWPVMAITVSVQRPELGRIVYAGSDFPHPFQLLGGLVMVWLNASGLEASRCAGIIGPGFWQDANGPLPLSHFQSRFRSSTDGADNIVQNQPGSGQVLARWIRSGSKPVCKNHPARFWPKLPP